MAIPPENRRFPRQNRGKPLNQRRLEDLALRYVARYATSEAKLRAYLDRKLRACGWEDAAEPDPRALAARHADMGHIDDRAYAANKQSGLINRGYGPQRVQQALRRDGIAQSVQEDMHLGEGDLRRAIVIMARKRRFGPFGEDADQATREKQLAALVRAGHSFGHARFVLDAQSVEGIEIWVEEGEGE